MTFEPPRVTLIGNLNDLLRGGCCAGNHDDRLHRLNIRMCRFVYEMMPRHFYLAVRIVKASYMMHVYDGFNASDLP